MRSENRMNGLKMKNERRINDVKMRNERRINGGEDEKKERRMIRYVKMEKREENEPT